jgi:hypothetical protein
LDTYISRETRNLKFEGEGFDVSDPISNFKYLWVGLGLRVAPSPQFENMAAIGLTKMIKY